MTQLEGIADHQAPATATQIEPKVTAATAASSAAGILLPLLLWVLTTWVGEVPVPVQAAIGTLLTGACTFAAGYYARHVNREA